MTSLGGNENCDLYYMVEPHFEKVAKKRDNNCRVIKKEAMIIHYEKITSYDFSEILSPFIIIYYSFYFLRTLTNI